MDIRGALDRKEAIVTADCTVSGLESGKFHVLLIKRIL